MYIFYTQRAVIYYFFSNFASMIPTKEYIERKFTEYNDLMFQGKLPPIPIELSNAKTFIGMCVCKKRRTLFGRIKQYDFRLRINARIDLSEQELDDTIIHEMIHYYIGVNNIKDTSSHGTVFRDIMQRINTTYGRHITISHKSTKEQREQLYDKRPRWHVVAIIHLRDGRTGIKVLPRIKTRIAYYYNNVSASPKVNAIELFLTNDIFFNRYPCSSALNVVYADKEEVMSHLSDAEPIHLT